MDIDEKEMDIESKVILLAILKKEDDESLNDIIFKLVESRVFDLKQGKKLLKKLKSENYISNGGLTMLGLTHANAALKEFTL
jgi:hypothetical protein